MATWVVSGSSGLLGSCFVRHLKRSHNQVLTLDRQRVWQDNYLRSLISNADFVVHCAANTDLAYCENHPCESYYDNVILSEAISKCCAKYGVRLIFISSAGVYGRNADRTRTEQSNPLPITVYHRDKLIAEKKILDADSASLVIRVGWLFGPNRKTKKNFILARVSELKEALINDGSLFVDDHCRGNPTSTLDVVLGTIELAKNHAFGLHNIVNKGQTSRAGYIQAIADTLDYEVRLVRGSQIQNMSAVPRILNETCEPSRLLANIGYKVPTWKESLVRCLEDSYQDMRFGK